jgi:hypothetical protein
MGNSLIIDEKLAYKVESLSDLLSYNKKLFKEFTKSEYFRILQDGTMSQRVKRECFLGCVQVFSNYFQNLMFSRVATCSDSYYFNTFIEHFWDEFGHDALLFDGNCQTVVADPVLKALSNWFSYQMLVKDNLEKVVLVHLVLEESGDYYHKIGHRVLSKYLETEYYKTHAKLDHDHSILGYKLLQNCDRNSFGRLATVAQEGWKMLSSMVARIVFIVKKSSN